MVFSIVLSRQPSPALLFFKLIEVETKFPFANSISEFSRSQDPEPTFCSLAPVDKRLISSGGLAGSICRNEILYLHPIHTIDDLQIGTGDRFDAPCWHQVFGVSIRVIKNVIDDVEAGRLFKDVLELAARATFRTRIDRNSKRLKRAKYHTSESFAAADEPTARAGRRRSHETATEAIGLRLRRVLAINDQRGFCKEVTHVLIDPFYARRAMMVVRSGDEGDSPAPLRLWYRRVISRDLHQHRDT